MRLLLINYFHTRFNAGYFVNIWSTITLPIGNDDVAEGDGALRQCIILYFTKSVGLFDATSSTRSSTIVPSAHNG